MDNVTTDQAAIRPIDAPSAVVRRSPATALSARGEPFMWALGAALTIGIVMVIGFLLFVFWNGLVTFIPKPVAVVTLRSGAMVAGEPTRPELYRLSPDAIKALPPAEAAKVAVNGGYGHRTLYRIGNYDLYNEDFRWVSDHDVDKIDYPEEMVFIERLEWGVFVGRIRSVKIGDRDLANPTPKDPALVAAHKEARARWQTIRRIERDLIGRVNHDLEVLRLDVRRAEIKHGPASTQAEKARLAEAAQIPSLKSEYDRLTGEAVRLNSIAQLNTVTLADVTGKEKVLPLSSLVRFYPANNLSFFDKVSIYLSRWGEFLSAEPREANTEGGVLPAIFGTVAMTLLMVLVVAPMGVITALYLREYAKQGRLVSIVRISVNNLAGVPSIVYGVFGLGFFAYGIGAHIDDLFFPERLPAPTFGTGGILWSALTLALLTVPVVIVATEEALSAVPRSMREGSLACGASKWQTIKNIVLPRAMPGIMTGIILAMARGAGEVAPLMLVGVVKLAPTLPFDGYFPFVHLERSFMHLGFHIYDVGFQSRNSEAGKPMVFVTTCLLIAVITFLNLAAIVIRSRLKRQFAGNQF
ncbi:phosphate ABC transporter permease PstA [Methylocystis suflitae]|uniref:phosphate ABC transporter permease PstA n=1 Tax=Methylocystis suflitae TaxID=2951405 RepID=UPI002109B9E9|nr:phosphate ABC transporter permease PstA [Methylocystis suflitae]MCQ4191289.1 phosphate ABC transporter permease PstA [Methylocystis suflitae]